MTYFTLYKKIKSSSQLLACLKTSKTGVWDIYDTSVRLFIGRQFFFSEKKQTTKRDCYFQEAV